MRNRVNIDSGFVQYCSHRRNKCQDTKVFLSEKYVYMWFILSPCHTVSGVIFTKQFR